MSADPEMLELRWYEVQFNLPFKHKRKIRMQIYTIYVYAKDALDAINKAFDYILRFRRNKPYRPSDLRLLEKLPVPNSHPLPEMLANRLEEAIKQTNVTLENALRFGIQRGIVQDLLFA